MSGPSVVAIVGSGPSLIGAGRGQEIDAADAVARMHDCHWHDARDHGARYDYGVLPGPWLSWAMKAIVRKPAVGWWLFHLAKQVRAPFKDCPVIDIDRWRVALLEVGGKCRIGTPAPTRGLGGIICAAHFLRPKTIKVYGMDAIMSGQPIWDCAPESHAMVKKSYPGLTPPKNGDRHDAAAERKVVDMVAKEYGVEIVGC